MRSLCIFIFQRRYTLLWNTFLIKLGCGCLNLTRAAHDRIFRPQFSPTDAFDRRASGLQLNNTFAAKTIGMVRLGKEIVPRNLLSVMMVVAGSPASHHRPTADQKSVFNARFVRGIAGKEREWWCDSQNKIGPTRRVRLIEMHRDTLKILLNAYLRATRALTLFALSFRAVARDTYEHTHAHNREALLSRVL